MQKRSRNLTILTGLLILFMIIPSIGQAAPPTQGPTGPDRLKKTLIDRLTKETNGQVRISYHAETGKVRFIGTSPDKPVTQPGVIGNNASLAETAQGFLQTYGALFGLKDPQHELNVMQERSLPDGRAFVRFQQTYQGIPIIGGELIIQMDKRRNLISANGEILPDLDLKITPQVDAQTARQTALAKVARGHGVNIADLNVNEPELWIHNPLLMGGPGRRMSRLVWRMEVTPVELLPIREFVIVDAHLAIVILNFNQIHTAKNRVIFDNNNDPNAGLPGNGPVRTEGNGPSGITDADLAYDYSGDTYDFFFNEHGRDSLDDTGLILISTTRYCDPSFACPFANAFWNGTQMVYGEGFSAADDVVGHELTHGVTDFSSHLFYYYQSGAINESFSDVWGEFIDQTNGAGTDTEVVKWQMGEDVPGFGAIRDMKDPTTFGDPDRINSPHYYCREGDSGGVHINSGVNNKAVYLMTDGGTFNGQTVTGLGITKVADLYYEAQTNMLTSGSNYQDLYDALIQAGLNLGFSAADQQQIRAALTAVEMNQRPCNDPPEASLCPVSETPHYLFVDDLENPASGNWTTGAIIGVSEWYYPQTVNPYAFDATYTKSGIYNFWGYNQFFTSDSFMAMTTDVTLPSTAYLHFNHDWAFEDDNFDTYDGGVVEYSLDGGSLWNDTETLFVANGYNGAISPRFDNPLAGRAGFVDESHGYTASRLDLSTLAGQNVRFRFRIGTDSIIDDFGWFIDDVSIYTCGDALYTIYLPTIIK